MNDQLLNGLATASSMKLSTLVDLALGTPEVGAVNFNILHTLLHALLNQLNITDCVTELDEYHRAIASRGHPSQLKNANLLVSIM